MSQARWIWYFGDFELYHSIKLHNRRDEFECPVPAFWALSAPYPNASFGKSFHCDTPDTVRVVTPHRGYVMLDGRRYAVNTDIPVEAGDHAISVVVLAESGFPCIFIDSAALVTDDSWVADHMVGKALPVGASPAYTSPDDDPTVFPFAYERRDAVKVTETAEGSLYDFGREMYGLIHLEHADPADRIRVVYGESAEEATDPAEALVRETVTGHSTYVLAGRAFRYVCVRSEKEQGGTQSGQRLSVYAEYEYVPLEDRASFTCNRPSVGKIWDICAYTLHLNSREFFLDGIKRDRWCWSGDAYQSHMASRYLYFDPDISKRTILALLGKPPYEQHINTINDYSMYLIISVWEYYFATADQAFVTACFDRLKALYDFIESRLDENGYVCQRPGDWIFIDWSDMDKGGPLCAEQILLWQCRRAMAGLAEVCGLDGTPYRLSADKLQKRILRDYWREDRGGFVDCHTTGLEHITRHANIFAIMYEFVSPRRAAKIVRRVLENDSITQITTPYFEFFELCALCKMGKLTAAQRKIESYWGGMVALGATSIWEEYIPEHTGTQHYAMYGRKYGCSLCHAWGGGPIYLLGRYCLGVYPTSAGYTTFTVEPNRGLYRRMEGKVPLPQGGQVSVRMDAHSCTVLTTNPGGTLRVKGQTYPLEAGQELTVTF